MKLIIDIPEEYKEQFVKNKCADLFNSLATNEFGYVLRKSFETATLEVQPCEDAISRQAVINRIANTCFWLSADNWEELIKCINSISPVTPQPKIGRWIRWYEVIESADGKSTDHIPHCKCSECGTEYEPYSSQFIKYCPNCGARMTEREEEE